jgi:glycerol-3-phosphate dehydrogenase
MKRILEAFKDERFDVLIVGGGITGTGVALDAALRGFRVALIDKGDFASGTSSASSKLVHGGLRYLEHGRLRLVYEALHERSRLLEASPHLVQPLRFFLPFYEKARVPSWKWRLGLTLYDILAGRGNLQRSRPLSAQQLLREAPGLCRDGLQGGATYYDAQMDDARLCLEVVSTASRAGARVANYVEALAFEKQEGRLIGARVADLIGGSEFTIRTRQILNAAGPWTDSVRRLAGDETGPKLCPTKGVHILAPGRHLPGAFLLLHPVDGRVFFVIPWLGKTLIGTTDTLYDQSPDSLTVKPDEIRYLLDGHNRYFRDVLEPADVLGSFAGLRPLIRNRPGAPAALSRESRVFISTSGLMTVAGGKYTTFRHMAEDITDELSARLGKKRSCRTRDLRLDCTPGRPWPDFANESAAALQKRYKLAERNARHLVERYGRNADKVAQSVSAEPALAEPIVAGEPDIRAELPYQRAHEMALFPSDHFLRRTRLGLFHPELLQLERAGSTQA